MRTASRACDPRENPSTARALFCMPTMPWHLRTSLRDSLSVSARRLIQRALLVCVGGSFGLIPSLHVVYAAPQPDDATAAVDIDDTSTTRRIQLLTVGLATAGLALAGVTWWLWRNTRPDPDALGPLDVMSQSRFRRQTPDTRDRSLSSLKRSHTEAPPAPVAVDLAALAAERRLPSLDDHAGFGDLVDASVPSEGVWPSAARQPAQQVAEFTLPKELAQPMKSMPPPLPPPPPPVSR
jgi:hypothetical protein